MKNFWNKLHINKAVFKSGLGILVLMVCVSTLSARNLDVDQYIDLVIKQNKSLKLAKEESAMAKASKKEAVSLALPKIMAEGNYRRNLSDSYMFIDLPLPGMNGESKFKINKDNEFSAQAVLSQTLLSYKVGSAIRAAKQYQKLADLIYEANQNKIITEGKKLFYQALLLKKVWEVSDASRQNAYENYLNIHRKFENGLVSEFELLQAEVRWKDFIPQTTRSEKNYRLVLVMIKNLAGIAMEEDVLLKGELTNYPALPVTLDINSILAARPDYNSLVWEEKLRKTNVSAQKADYLPSLSGNLVYNFSSQSDKWRFDQQNKVWIAGLTLSVPIYTGGYTGAQVQKAKIELKKTRLRMEQSEQDIFAEIQNIKLRLREAQERIKSAQATLNTAQKAFKIAENTAASGLATQLQLKDSRLVLDQAQLNYHSAIYDYRAAYLDWQYACGNISSD